MKKLAAVFALASGLGGCAAVPGHHVSVSAGEESPQYKVIEVTADNIALTRPAEQNGFVVGEQQRQAIAGQVAADPNLLLIGPGSPGMEYRIGAGDVLSVVVWDHPELTNPAGEFRDAASAGRLVAADGTVFFPYAGIFKAAGRTTREVQDHLAKSLSRVIKEPQVDVRIAAFRSQRVQVTGEVRQPGIVMLDDTAKGVLDAINERGGLLPEASRREAILVRGQQTYRMDLGGLLSGNRPAGNPMLLAGDVIHVPDATDDQVYVLGEVAKPAPVRMYQRSTPLIQVLTATGGMDQARADDSGVLVFRRPAKGDPKAQATIFALDMSGPEGMLLATEFELAPRDVVYIKATGFARYNSVIGQLLPTISAVFQLDRLIDN